MEIIFQSIYFFPNDKVYYLELVFGAFWLGEAAADCVPGGRNESHSWLTIMEMW